MKKFSTGKILCVCIIKVLSPDDSEGCFPELDKAKEQEIEGIMDSIALETVLEEDVLKEAANLGGRFVLGLKVMEEKTGL